MENQFITIRGAKEHNLKNIDIRIPRNQFVVITGLSGSGKSSLAFDTIYAEGQRRYVESLSAYARQFLEQLQKPNVELIEGLSPTISIEQKTTSRNPRSTVSTQTEINDYLRLLFARVGTPFCPNCGKPIERQTIEEIVEQIFSFPAETPITVMAPLVRGRKGEYRKIAEQVSKAGFTRMRVDGKIVDVQEKVKLDKYKVHNVDVVVDRLTIKPSIKKRLTDSIETALQTGQGLVMADFGNKFPEKIYSEHYACIDCGTSIAEIEPRTFSFNSPYGACPDCNGLGMKMEIDPEILVPDKTKAWVYVIAPARMGSRGYLMYYRAVMRELGRLYRIPWDTGFQDLSKSFKKTVLYGSEDIIWGKPYEGVVPYLERMFKETDNDWLKDEISKYMSESACPGCNGSRLKKESLSVKIDGRNIAQVSMFSIKDAKDFFANIKFSKDKKIISESILKEIIRRLDFCINVGLDYLTLDRKSSTLSGGEAERIRLATQVGSGLVGVIYILDEPSIGLHQKDNERLLSTLHALRDLGNSLIVVEHDEDTIRKSDFVIDLGPGAGEYGGQIIYAGPTKGILESKGSLTGQYLNGKLKINLPMQRRPIDSAKQIKVTGAEQHNLKNINVSFPLGTFICVTGRSASGKSTFVADIRYKALARKMYQSKHRPGKLKRLEGGELIDKMIVGEQSARGRNTGSNPTTYTDGLRNIRY